MKYLKESKLLYLIVLLLFSLFAWSELKNIDLLSDIFNVTVRTLFIPTVMALFIYYLLKPLYLQLLRFLKHEIASLIFTLLIFIGVVLFLVREFIPLLLFQIDTLVAYIPQMIQEVDQWLITAHIFSGENIENYLQLFNRSFTDFINLLFVGLQSGTNWIFSLISSSFLVISLMPIMVIYMLINTNKSKTFHLKLPTKYQSLVYEYFVELEKTLANYISGKAIVCFYVFLGAWLTFSLAGLQGALLFAVVAGVMDVVPYFGPWIGVIPGVITALMTKDVNTLFIIVGIILVQVGESYLVSPYVMSKELKMHPLFVIVVMLITGQIFGILGMIVVLPVLAVLKVSVIYGLKLQKLRKKNDSLKL